MQPKQGSTWRRHAVVVFVAVLAFSRASVLAQAVIFVDVGPGVGPVIDHCHPEQKLTASDGAEGDQFGRKVSISSEVAIVGATNDDDRGPRSGSAYVFRYNDSTWVEEQKLTASDRAEDDRFGVSVSTSGDVAIVGTTRGDGTVENSGSAYVFRHNGTAWVEEAKLMASDGAEGDWFGSRVSTSRDVTVVGAPFDDDNHHNSGSAYVFRYNGSVWVEEQKLTAIDGAENDRFGSGVSISGDAVIVGATGAAYVFRHDGSAWVFEQTLSGGAEGDQFGSAVSISGDVALVGAMSDDDNGEDSGSAYVFRYNDSTWVEEQKLTASDGAEGDVFGRVSISGDAALVGAISDDDNGEDSGSAYVFRYNGDTWVEEAKLTASDGAAEDYFGQVAISDHLAFVGADAHNEHSGSAYLFDLNCACPADIDGNGAVDFDDLLRVLDAWGNEGGPEDLDGSGTVDFNDLLVVLASWGPCS